ncbi:MAG TPA: peptide-N-glycosidase F-related protein [Myxococcota bacterium]|nr:peptide-N-glycosidase F-related protein [Myxococcota bacterium]HQK51214.1 peptide-N-glycosidase F-related protein [Myxococcota bacterium]
MRSPFSSGSVRRPSRSCRWWVLLLVATGSCRNPVTPLSDGPPGQADTGPDPAPEVREDPGKAREDLPREATGTVEEASDALPADPGEAPDTPEVPVATDPGGAPDPGNPAPCPDGTPRMAFQPAEDRPQWFATAADLVIPTTTGPRRLADLWTGCGSLLFVPDRPRQNTGWPDTLFQYDVNLLLHRLPSSAQVLLLSIQDDAEARRQTLDRLQGAIDAYLEGLQGPEAEDLRGRIHLVTEAGGDLPGWLGALIRSPGWGVAVDRFQRIRFLGSFADPSRYDPSRQWFGPNLAMVANEARYYDFEARREADLQGRPARVIPVFQGQVLADPQWAGVQGIAEVALPDALTMAAMDTLEADLTLDCDGNGEYGTCPPWDYLVHLRLCDREDPDRCEMEIGRWVTTYHRWGRWVHDLSPLIPLIRDGGTRRLAFYTQQPYRVTLSLRIRDSGKATRPVEARFLFEGGPFDPSYNDRHPPRVEAIPPEAARVLLAFAVTGHGGVEPGNCAEFCRTEHHFTVNGHDHEVSFPEAGSSFGCMDEVDQGTVPNQYGTWWHGRNGWCPGREVPLRTLDVTADVTPGTDAVFEYRSLYQGQPYPGTGAALVLSSWLVVEVPRQGPPGS